MARSSSPGSCLAVSVTRRHATIVRRALLVGPARSIASDVKLVHQRPGSDTEYHVSLTQQQQPAVPHPVLVTTSKYLEAVCPVWYMAPGYYLTTHYSVRHWTYNTTLRMHALPGHSAAWTHCCAQIRVPGYADTATAHLAHGRCRGSIQKPEIPPALTLAHRHGRGQGPLSSTAEPKAGNRTDGATTPGGAPVLQIPGNFLIWRTCKASDSLMTQPPGALVAYMAPSEAQARRHGCPRTVESHVGGPLLVCDR